MRIKAEQLKQQLTQNTPKILLLNGNEILLVEESLDLIRSHYRQQGFLERLTYSVDAKFDWNELGDAGQNMSLFSESRLIEIRLPSAKPGKAGAQFFTDLMEQMAFGDNSDAYLIITDGLSKQQRSNKWIAMIESTGLLVDVFEIKSEQLPQWLKLRFQSRALRVEAGVIETLAIATEGNLLAAAQIIDQLQVLAPDGGVPMSLLQQTLEDQSRFSVFSFVDSCLLGQAADSIHRLERIRAETDSAILLLWSLSKQTRELLSMSKHVAAGQSIGQVMQQFRVWSSRQRFISAALQRHDVNKLKVLLSRLAHLDEIAKGQRHGDVWHELEKLCLSYCGIETIPIVTNNSVYEANQYSTAAS